MKVQMIFSSQCCLDGAFVFFIPRSKYQINICNSILHYRELMVFGVVIVGNSFQPTTNGQKYEKWWWCLSLIARLMLVWVSARDSHQSYVRSLLRLTHTSSREYQVLAPNSRNHLALHPGPAPAPPLGSQFLCSNLSSLLRASLSLLFFVQSQLGARIPGYRGQCIDHVRKLLWHWLWSMVSRVHIITCHKGCVTLTQ